MESHGDHAVVVVRRGVLFKKGSGGGPFGRKNWKPRYFVLTQQSLRYYIDEEGPLKGELDISRCGENAVEIMPEDCLKTGTSASTVWRIAINTPDRRFLFAASTEHEMLAWADALMAVFQANVSKVTQPQLPQKELPSTACSEMHVDPTVVHAF